MGSQEQQQRVSTDGGTTRMAAIYSEATPPPTKHFDVDHNIDPKDDQQVWYKSNYIGVHFDYFVNNTSEFVSCVFVD